MCRVLGEGPGGGGKEESAPSWALIMPTGPLHTPPPLESAARAHDGFVSSRRAGGSANVRATTWGTGCTVSLSSCPWTAASRTMDTVTRTPNAPTSTSRVSVLGSHPKHLSLQAGEGPRGRAKRKAKQNKAGQRVRASPRPPAAAQALSRRDQDGAERVSATVAGCRVTLATTHHSRIQEGELGGSVPRSTCHTQSPSLPVILVATRCTSNSE